MSHAQETPDAWRLRPSPSRVERVAGVFASSRLTTRVWFDLLAPTAMLLAVRPADLPLGRSVVVLVITVLFHTASNYFNDMNDTAVDSASTERSRLGRATLTGRVTGRDLAIAGWTLTGVSIALSLLLPWPAVVIMVAFAVLSTAYNFEPLHLAGRPLVLQLFWPIVWALLFVLCVVAVDGHWRPALPFVAFTCLFMGLGEGISQDIRDADNDQAGGRRTTPVVYGVPATVTVSWVAQVTALIPWLIFATGRPLPLAATIIGTAALAVWLVCYAFLARRLHREFDKPAARLAHLGPVYAFTIVNLATIVGILAGG